jgi:acyl carrier protein
MRGTLANMTGVEASSLKEDTVLFEIPGVDSLRLIEIATYIEATHKVAPTEEQMRELRTLGDLAALLEALLKKGKS